MGKGKPSKTPWPPPQRHQITTCSMSPPSARPPVFHQPVTYKVTPDRCADKDTSGKPWRTTRERMRLSTPMTPLPQTLAASTPHYLVMHMHRHHRCALTHTTTHTQTCAYTHCRCALTHTTKHMHMCTHTHRHTTAVYSHTPSHTHCRYALTHTITQTCAHTHRHLQTHMHTSCLSWALT